MALVKRGSLNRPLTVSELDGNFEHIIDLISSNVSGATGLQGPSASLELQQVLNNGRQSNIGINIYSSDYGLHVLSQKELSENGDYYKSFVLGNNDDFVIALENILGDHYPVIYFNTDVSLG